MEAFLCGFYTHPWLCSNRDQHRTSPINMCTASLSNESQFQLTRMQVVYVGPPFSNCVSGVNVSNAVNTLYVLPSQDANILTMTYLTQEYAGSFLCLVIHLQST